MSLSQAACKKTVCVIDHKLLHDASFTMVNVLDGPCFTAKCQHCVTYGSNELLQSCGCHLYQTHDGEDVTELNISKDD